MTPYQHTITQKAPRNVRNTDIFKERFQHYLLEHLKESGFAEDKAEEVLIDAYILPLTPHVVVQVI